MRSDPGRAVAMTLAALVTSLRVARLDWADWRALASFVAVFPVVTLVRPKCSRTDSLQEEKGLAIGRCERGG